MLFQTSLDKIKRWLLQGHFRHYRTLSSALQDTLTIAGISIRQDAQGRFCLNDLHKAAGEEKAHQPAFWMRNVQTADLIKEIAQSANSQIAPCNSIRGGTNPGTYVCKELVYAYAMWISSKFHLQVIRAYDELVTSLKGPLRIRRLPRLQPPPPSSPSPTPPPTPAS